MAGGDEAVAEGVEPAKGADLVREALARAREDARAKAARSERGVRRASRESAKEASRAARATGEPVAFGSALGELLADRGWQTQAAGASVLSRWESLVGEQVAAHCRPTRLHEGELMIEAESTAWATQLRLLSRTLTARLAEQLGADVVRKIVVRGPSGPDWRHGALRVTGGRGPRDTYG
jgi:predicted nucleic acid-binding Zn ribbon protein